MRPRRDNRTPSTLHRERGFATITILLLATAIFTLLTLVLSSTYELQNENQRFSDEIQQRVSR